MQPAAAFVLEKTRESAAADSTADYPKTLPQTTRRLCRRAPVVRQPGKKLNYSFFSHTFAAPPHPLNNVEQEAANKKKRAHTSTLFWGVGRGICKTKL